MLKSQTKEISEDVYVVKGLARPLLGVRACEELGLVKRIYNVYGKLTDVDAKKEFPDIFRGLGKLDIPYTIKLKEDARPFAVHSPRRVPISLMEKVKLKLKIMAEMDDVHHSIWEEPIQKVAVWN